MRTITKPRFLLIVCFGILVLSENVFAYIDPGTGGVLLNTIWPLIVALFSVLATFFVKWFWKPIKSTFSKIFGKSN